MTGILIDVEEGTHLKLQDLAKENHRSVRSQIVFMLKNALKT